MRPSRALLAVLALACTRTTSPATSGAPQAPAFEAAGPASPRLPDIDGLDTLSSTVDAHFEAAGTNRVHVQLDRPLYRPGDTVWVKSWAVRTRDFSGHPHPAITYELLDPRSQVVATKWVQQQGGTATNDLVLPSGAPGGRWTLRATAATGEIDERPFIVSSYQAPTIQKELDFVREAYGPGDTVEALVELRTRTGAPLADHPVQVVLQVDGQAVTETTLRTSEEGAVLATGTLPEPLRSGDGLLTVLVEHGGITESISRSVPILLADASLRFFPEGGDLVEGLPGRVYLRATNRHGEPADVQGHITDDRGTRVATFATVHDGLGRVAFTPAPGRTYQAHVTSPAGIDVPFPLPAASPKGCTLRSYDDWKGTERALRVGVRCTDARTVLVHGMLREATLDAAAVAVRPGRESLVYLDPGDERADQPGAARVTLFDEARHPLAERLVYRNHGAALRIGLTTDQTTYGPRDEVIVDVTTTDPSGDPVPAELALSVVDDAVLTLADDENGHLLTRLYLEPELVESPEDPAFYFDPEEERAAQAMDLVMGTLGHRRFEWRPVFHPTPTPQVEKQVVQKIATGMVAEDDWDVEAMPELERMDEMAEVPVAAMAPEPEPSFRPAPPPVVAAPAPLEDNAWFPNDPQMRNDAREAPMLGVRANRKRRAPQGMDRMQAYAPVRVFPAPDYQAGFDGVRTDFRDTVHWAPTVTTGAKGTAQVRFYLSDAVTSFRITAEGLGGGYAGHAEATLESVLPVSIATTLPPAVSVGDELHLPLTVTSTRSEDLPVTVRAELTSSTLTLAPDDAEHALTLPAGGAESRFVPITVGSGSETATVRLVAEGGGLSDTVERTLEVVPAGFPQAVAFAEDAPATFELELTDVVDHSLAATVTWHPSPVSSLITGMDGLIRTPGGCFEQTSSTNWPNVAILRYLEAHDGDPRLRAQSARALDVGYEKLTGYQVGAGGFETWGSGPGKEALSAFGLLQFADMAAVYDVAPAVLDRDASYLLAQRDGKGGYARTGESAHGYGSAPKPVLDGFITYALVETGHHETIAPELDHQAEVGRTSTDPYVLALATRALLKAGNPTGKRALERLTGMQAEDGSFPGAESSITRSYEANLLVESTALAALAMMEGDRRVGADRAVDWLIDNRQGGGTWGATQATALALGALTEHAERSKVPRTDGRVQIVVNGEPMQVLSYRADHVDPLVLDDWASALRTGTNVIEVRQLDGEPLPYSIDVAWSSVTPATAEGAELTLQTSLDQERVGMGETVRLRATVGNRLDRIVPSPIARIGLPAGLEAQTWQLEELQERGQIAFFETRPREVTLYWDGIHPRETHDVALDLVATVPGAFTAPASAAYPYYNDDEKAWVAGATVRIDTSR